MSSKKESDFDALDFWQKHNRNVQLKRSADAAEEVARAQKEQAMQARLEREANDLHRAQMDDLARKEREAKEFSKQQQLKLYDISCQIEELEKQETIIARIQLFCDLKESFEKIVHDAIEDLQFRKLYMQVKAALKKEGDIISRDYEEELSLCLKFHTLKEQAEQYNDIQIIQTFEQLRQAEHLFDELQVISEDHPELSINNSFFIQKCIERFQESAEAIKWFFDNFTDNDLIESIPQLFNLLFSFYKLDKRILQHGDWEYIKARGPSPEGFNLFCNFCIEFVQKNNDYFKTIIQLMECIDNPEAEKTAQEIKDLLEKTEKKKIEEKKNGCYGCVFLSVILFAAGIYSFHVDKKGLGVGLIVIGCLFVISAITCILDLQKIKQSKTGCADNNSQREQQTKRKN